MLAKDKLELYKAHDYCVSDNPKVVVVLIHGLASDSSTFDGLLEHLEKDARLKNVRFVSFDLLGSGKSINSDELEYDYKEQIGALKNSIDKLDINNPLVLIGHSLGTLIVTRYAKVHSGDVSKLILVSPPVFTEQDLDNPAFKMAMDGFKKAVSIKKHDMLNEKSFINSIEKIVENRKNYDTLVNVSVPTTLIYGELDEIIGAHNIPKLKKLNPTNIKTIRTGGKHGVTRDKYDKISAELEKFIDEII